MYLPRPFALLSAGSGSECARNSFVPRRLAFLSLVFLHACLQIGPPGTDGTTGAGASTSTPAGVSSETSKDAGSTISITATNAVGCGADTTSGVVLCKGVSACSGLRLDSEIYPDCGFRVPSSSIDLECVCGDYLCPVGAALNCTQAANLLADQSEYLVCLQQMEGRCAPRSTKPAKASSCDQTCLAECAGNSGCAFLCGCG